MLNSFLIVIPQKEKKRTVIHKYLIGTVPVCRLSNKQDFSNIN